MTSKKNTSNRTIWEKKTHTHTKNNYKPSRSRARRRPSRLGTSGGPPRRVLADRTQGPPWTPYALKRVGRDPQRHSQIRSKTRVWEEFFTDSRRERSIRRSWDHLDSSRVLKRASGELAVGDRLIVIQWWWWSRSHVHKSWPFVSWLELITMQLVHVAWSRVLL